MFRPTNRTMAHAVAWALLVPWLSACADADDPQAPAVPASPHASVVDLTGGHFSFLSPLGPGTKAGVFNPGLSPVVEICRLGTSSQPTETTPCASLVAWFTSDGGSDGSRVTLDERREMYAVGWNLARYTLPTGYYRVFVRSAPSSGTHTTFGFTDLAVAPSRSQARALAGPGVHPVTATSDLPIKFRIEEGAICGATDCFEGSVGPAGGVFITNTEFAGVQIPEGALADTRTLIIERVTEQDVPFCLPTAQPQYEGCYRYRLEPALAPGETFALETIVGVCLDPAAVPFEDQLVLQKWDEHDPGTLETLPRREIDFLECADFSLASIDAAGTFATLASAGGRFIASIAHALLPQPLYAGSPSPYGGGLNDFSRIGWVRPLAIRVMAGDEQTACTNTTLPIDPRVRVKSALTTEAVAGVPVGFSVTTGGGSVGTAATTTDVGGDARTSWILGGAAGSQTMTATASNPLTGWPQWPESVAWGSAVVPATAIACAP